MLGHLYECFKDIQFIRAWKNPQETKKIIFNLKQFYIQAKDNIFYQQKLLLKTFILYSFDFYKSLQKYCIMKRNVLQHFILCYMHLATSISEYLNI